MKTKRLISLLLAAVFALSAAATPALAASAGSELPDLTTAEQQRCLDPPDRRRGSDLWLPLYPERPDHPGRYPVYRRGDGHQRRSAGLCDPDPFGQDPHPAQDDPPAEKDVGEP